MPVRRRGGVGGIQRRQRQKEKFEDVGASVEEEKVKHVEQQLEVLRSSLTEFARKYKADINKNPGFRQAFQRMAQDIGVDVLQSNKSFWAKMLGLGDFYYELSVQIVDVCISTRRVNGGLITLDDLSGRLSSLRPNSAQEITHDDIERAIKKLRVLGGGYAILAAGPDKIVKSVPTEINIDHTSVLSLARQHSGSVTKSQIADSLSWPDRRSDAVLDLLVQEGMAWIDSQGDEPSYWFPSLWDLSPESSDL